MKSCFGGAWIRTFAAVNAGTSSTRSIEIAGQTVYFGTSEDLSAVADESVDFIITSPPYWDLKDYGHAQQIGPGSYDRYLERLNAVWAECFRVAKPEAVLVVDVANRRVRKRYYPIATDIAAGMSCGWTLWDTDIWYIPNALPQPNHYRERLLDNKFEFLLVFTKEGRSDYKFHKPRVPQKYRADPRVGKNNPRGRCLGNILRIPAYRPPNIKELGYHQAAFPEELVAFFLATYTDPHDVVLDPFLGSGTTLKVSRVMGRRGIGFELTEAHCELIRQRINEPWTLPDWTDIDLIHSTTPVTGCHKPRRIQFRVEAGAA